MIRRFGLSGLVFVFLFGGTAAAQEPLLDGFPALRDKAMVLQITTRVQENSQEVWNAYNSKVTIPGRPVSIKLLGENLIVSIQFTPYLREGKYALVAQSQIWINIPEKGMSYKTATHSIPMDLGESILFFPLGSGTQADNPHIELLLVMYRYGEEPAPVPDPADPAQMKPSGETKSEQKPEARPAAVPAGSTGGRSGAAPGAAASGTAVPGTATASPGSASGGSSTGASGSAAAGAAGSGGR